jgi:hypothetical protein
MNKHKITQKASVHKGNWLRFVFSRSYPESSFITVLSLTCKAAKNGSYRVIKKSLCTWWLQYRKLQVMFKVSPASLQIFINTSNCVLGDRVQYSTVHIANVFCDGHLQIMNFVGTVRIHWVFHHTDTFWSPCRRLWKLTKETSGKIPREEKLKGVMKGAYDCACPHTKGVHGGEWLTSRPLSLNSTEGKQVRTE